METIQKHKGSCHCGKIRFEAELDPTAGTRCNCSVCTKVGATGEHVHPSAFVVHGDEATFSTYEWGGRTGRRYFCPDCGVSCYSRGHLKELGGDYVSVNLNCLDDIEPTAIKLFYWDGRHDNWEAGPRDTPWPVKTSA
jgi:hypothetical protein